MKLMKKGLFATTALVFAVVVASGPASLQAQAPRALLNAIKPVPELSVSGAGTAVAILAAAAFIAMGRRRRSERA
jgi:hypothetical protein